MTVIYYILLILNIFTINIIVRIYHISINLSLIVRYYCYKIILFHVVYHFTNNLYNSYHLYIYKFLDHVFCHQNINHHILFHLTIYRHLFHVIYQLSLYLYISYFQYIMYQFPIISLTSMSPHI